MQDSALARISGATRLVFLAGYPVQQVRAPDLLNARFAQHKLDITCVPINIPESGFDAFLSGAAEVTNLLGVVITVPHKFSAARNAHTLSERSALAGAANVLRRGNFGWEADLLDGIGFVRGLEREGHELAGADVFLAGAGGAGTAISISLLEAGVKSLAIHDLNAARVSHLLDKLSPLSNGRAYRASGASDTYSVAINGTTCGLSPDDPLPFDTSLLRADCIVAEVIMKPATTKLLETATLRGLRVHKGLHMLDGQLEAMAEFLTR